MLREGGAETAAGVSAFAEENLHGSPLPADRFAHALRGGIRSDVGGENPSDKWENCQQAGER